MNRTSTVQRPDPRPDLRDAPARERKRKGDVDPFYFDPDKIPDGSSYEWKRKDVFGQVDVSHQIHMQENGWLPVDAKRHPEYMPPGYTGAIERSGMVLMERPVELTVEARQEDKQAARDLVRNNEAQLSLAPDDTLPRDHRDVRPRINRSIEAHRQIPE